MMSRGLVLFALAIFFVVAHATELSMSEQLAQSNAENARLRTENKDLRSHLGTADDENARLRAENMDLRSQLGMTAVNDESAANVDDVPMLANDASNLDEFLDMNSEWSGVVGAGVKYSRWMLKWIVKKYSWLFSATFNRRVRVPRGRPLKQEKCLPIKGTDAYKGFVKEDCSLTEIGINCTKNSIEYVGTPGRPKWNIMGGSVSETVDCTNTQLSSNKTEPGGGGQVAVEASVSCPCNEGGKVLNMSVARARILSQIIALRIPQWRVNACWNAHSVLAPVIEDKDKSCFYMKWFLTKASFSTMLMISCWRKHCAPGGPQLDTDLDLEWGGGVAC